jgi:hypothetical protein
MLLKVLTKQSDVYRRLLKASQLKETIEKTHQKKSRIISLIHIENELEQIYQHIFHLYRTQGQTQKGELLKKYQDIKEACDEYYQLGPLSTKSKHYGLLIYTIYHFCVEEKEISSLYSGKHLEFFEQNPIFLKENTDEYLKALNNSIVLHLDEPKKVNTLIAKLESITQKSNVDNLSIAQRIFEIKYSAKLAICVNQRLMDEGLELVPEISHGLTKYKHLGMSIDRYIRLGFGVALLYFWKRDWYGCLEWIGKVEDMYQEGAAYVIGYVRILKIIAHFELQHYALAESLIKATKRYLTKNNRLFNQEHLLLKTIGKLCQIPKTKHSMEFQNLQKKLSELSKYPRQESLNSIMSILPWINEKAEA